jgi:hypothetical protein
MIQKKNMCSSCPWRKDGDRSVYFLPATLQRTIVNDFNEGRVQACHGNHEHMCAGQLAFAEHKLGGVEEINNAQVAIRFGLLKKSSILKSADNIFDSVPEMLEDHEKRHFWAKALAGV